VALLDVLLLHELFEWLAQLRHNYQQSCQKTGVTRKRNEKEKEKRRESLESEISMIEMETGKTVQAKMTRLEL
jgi:hypothetical protein